MQPGHMHVTPQVNGAERALVLDGVPFQHIQMLRGERDDGAFKVVEATTLPPWTEDTDLTVVGRRASRVEGEAKITGRARYAYEMRLPDQLYACVLRSPYPHARLRRPRPGHLTSTRKEILRANRSAMSGVIWRRVCVRQIS